VIRNYDAIIDMYVHVTSVSHKFPLRNFETPTWQLSK